MVIDTFMLPRPNTLPTHILVMYARNKFNVLLVRVGILVHDPVLFRDSTLQTWQLEILLAEIE